MTSAAVPTTGDTIEDTAAASHQITNVAAGSASAASTDAINGSKLFAADAVIPTVGSRWLI